MKPLTQLAHDLIRREIGPDSEGLLAIDATAGNGHDTQFLAELVGHNGRVWAIDIQAAAIAKTQERIRSLIDRVELCVADHADLNRIIPPEYHGRIAVVMFNLGYLPGGEKATITRPESTLAALSAASKLLSPGGMLSVIAYPGHPGGDQEAAAVAAWGGRQAFEVISSPPVSSPISPQHWLVRRIA